MVGISVAVPQHVKDAKEKADKEAKEMAEQLENEKRGEMGSKEPEKPEENVKASLGNAPQVGISGATRKRQRKGRPVELSHFTCRVNPARHGNNSF